MWARDCSKKRLTDINFRRSANFQSSGEIGSMQEFEVDGGIDGQL